MLAHEETAGKLGGGEARVAHSSQGLRVLCIAYVLEGLWSWSSKLYGKVQSGANNWPRKGGSRGGARRELARSEAVIAFASNRFIRKGYAAACFVAGLPSTRQSTRGGCLLQAL